MIIIHDSASAADALARHLEPIMRIAIEAELTLLIAGEHDLTDQTDVLVIEQGDTEEDIGCEAGFSLLVAPITGMRFGQPGFEPSWDVLTLRGGVFRLVITYGSTFATVLLVPDTEGIDPDLLALCRAHTNSRT